MTAPTSHARAHLPEGMWTMTESELTEIERKAYEAGRFESRAIAMLDDDQLWATFFRWRTVLRGETAARSLREKLSMSEYVDAIFAKVPE